jgi:hypothetical protein
MDGQDLQVGGAQHDINVTPVERTYQLAGKPGGEQGRLLHRVGHFDQQVDIAPTRRIIQPRTKQAHHAASTDFGTDDLLDGGDL